MPTPIETFNELLKKQAAESVRLGEQVKERVGALTLQALQARDLSLTQIRQVLRSVADGATLGAAKRPKDAEEILDQVVAGMDAALLKAVQASQVALQQLSRQGADLQGAQVQKWLGDLQKMEGEFFKVLQQSAKGADAKLAGPWAEVLSGLKLQGTASGTQIEGALKQVQETIQQSREASLRASELVVQNFATLTRGVLMGLSESLEQAGSAPAASDDDSPKPARKSSRKS